MDPELQALGVQLAENAVRNTAATVGDKIRALKTRKQDRETIAELEEIVNGLLEDKNELVRIAYAYEQQLVAQQISESDIAYISDKFVPILRQLMESAAAEQGGDSSSVQAMLSLLQPILSVETVTVLQLLGFNFRKAIGEPLTELVAQLISSRRQVDPTLGLETQRLLLALALDPDASDRFNRLTGGTAVAG